MLVSSSFCASSGVVNGPAEFPSLLSSLPLALSHRQGATATNELVNVGDFFASQVLPELQATDVNALPVLKADALKFLTTFRGIIAKPACIAALPALVELLRAVPNVVHSYAAVCLERLLTVREPDRSLRFLPEDLAPRLQQVLGNLFGSLEQPDSAENEYVMKCIVRVVTFMGPGMKPYAPTALAKLTATLGEVCKNPRSPGFNHYLFEAIAGLVCCSCRGDAAGCAAAEALLFGPFQAVLAADVQEFAPYVFQVLSLLVELRPIPLPGAYLAIFPALLAPMLWERPANVPALVRLLQAYLLKVSGGLGGWPCF